MQLIVRERILVLVPQDEAEVAVLTAWKARHAGAVLAPTLNAGDGLSLVVLGPRETVCREPINISSRCPQPHLRLISNLAPTPFVLDGVSYACVEAFWQSLRFPEAQRAEIAALDGARAKQASHAQPYGTHVIYGGEVCAVGTWAHWQLMRRACRAKFEQCEAAREALLATGEQPLTHRMRVDSRTIPGVIMADIWMGLRAQLRKVQAPVERG